MLTCVTAMVPEIFYHESSSNKIYSLVKHRLLQPSAYSCYTSRTCRLHVRLSINFHRYGAHARQADDCYDITHALAIAFTQACFSATVIHSGTIAIVTPWPRETSWTAAARRQAAHCRTPATPSLHRHPTLAAVHAEALPAPNTTGCSDDSDGRCMAKSLRHTRLCMGLPPPCRVSLVCST